MPSQPPSFPDSPGEPHPMEPRQSETDQYGSPATAAGYLFSDPSWIRNIATGTFLLLMTPLIIPLFLVAGFCWRTSTHLQEGKAPPTFRNFRSLFIDGVKLTGAAFLSVVSITLILYLGFVTVFAIGSTLFSPELFETPLFLAVLIIPNIPLFLLPATLTAATANNRVRAAIAPGNILIAFRLRYFVLWIIAFGFIMAAMIPSAIFMLFGPIGFALSALTLFYTLVALTSVFTAGLAPIHD